MIKKQKNWIPRGSIYSSRKAMTNVAGQEVSKFEKSQRSQVSEPKKNNSDWIGKRNQRLSFSVKDSKAKFFLFGFPSFLEWSLSQSSIHLNSKTVFFFGVQIHYLSKWITTLFFWLTSLASKTAPFPLCNLTLTVTDSSTLSSSAITTTQHLIALNSFSILLISFFYFCRLCTVREIEKLDDGRSRFFML